MLMQTVEADYLNGKQLLLFAFKLYSAEIVFYKP